MTIPLAKPWLDEAEETAVVDVLRSGWLAQGERVALFEKQFAQYIASGCAVAVSSGTAALHLAALSLGLQPGDEVLVPAFTFVSTIHAIEWTGAIPVFCDIAPATFNIAPDQIRQNISSVTKAVVVVHQFGLAAEPGELSRFCRDKELLMIEDAACALGTYHDRKHVGTLGNIGCFSFHPRKSITTGEGGMIVTNDARFHESCLQLRNIGASTFPDRTTMPDYPRLGLNYRMTDLQAAIGSAQLAKLPIILNRRRECAVRYDAMIKDFAIDNWIEPPVIPDDRSHSFQSYVVKLRTTGKSVHRLVALREKRDRLIAILAGEGIETRPGTHAPYLLGYYKNRYGRKPEDFPNALEADCLSIALPLYPQLSAEDQERVCRALRRSFPFVAGD